MGLTRLAIYRPIITFTVLAAVVLLGVMSLLSLGLEQSPPVNTPIVTVQVIYRGASSLMVEQQVTRFLEDAIATLTDIDTMTSSSGDAVAVVSVQFKDYVNVNTAMNDVQQKVQGVRKDLPADIDEPTYLKVDLNDVPILYLALTSRDGSAGPVDLYRVADDVVRRRLEQVDGVGRIRIVGGQEPEVQVRVSPERLRAHGLGFGDVIRALQNQYVTVAGGELRTGRGEGGRTSGLRVESRQTPVEQIGDLPVSSLDGFSTELRNVADAYMGGKEPEQIARFNGEPAVGILVYKQSTANITQTADAVVPVVQQLNDGLPRGLKLEVALDRTTSIRHSIKDMETELVLAIVLTGLVLLLFLHTLRATLIVVVAIPVCLLVAAIAMRWLGLSLNTMTLIGLTASIGILVDDSIVVLENIFTHLEHGEEPKTAAVKGRSEIGMAAIAITLIDVAVYGPILFISGITGAMIYNFAVVMVVATLASLMVSFTVTPLLASRWLTLNDNRSLIARITSSWEPAYHALERRFYPPALDWALRHRPIVILVAIALLGVAATIPARLGGGFVPEPDDRLIYVTGELPGGTSLESTDEAARRWEAALKDPQVFPYAKDLKGVYTVVGRGDSDADLGSRLISLSIDVGAAHERHGHKAAQIRRQAIETGEAAVPDLKGNIGGGRIGPPGQPVQIRLLGNDLDQLAYWANTAATALEARPDMQDVKHSMVNSPEMVIRPDPQRVKDLGLTVQSVASAVRAAYQGVTPVRFVEADGKERDIRVRVTETLRYEPERLGDLPIGQRGGTLLTLDQVVDMEPRPKPVRILHVNRERAALVSAEPRDVPLSKARVAAESTFQNLGLPANMRFERAGAGKEQQKSDAELRQGIITAIILEYLILVILYESLMLPLVVLLSLPLAAVGAFGGLLVFGGNMSIPAMIGLIALIGVVGKNAILLVDRTNNLRAEGMPRDQALRQAGPDRLRPILMTSLTLIVGLMPVAMQWGEGAELRAPVAMVLVGGMVTSTILSLVFVPVVYTYIDALRRLPSGVSSGVRRLSGGVRRLTARGRGSSAQPKIAGGATPTITALEADRIGNEPAGDRAALFDSEGRRVAEWADTLTCGRGRENDLVLAHDEVSRFHVRFERGLSGYLVTDLDSSNGTYLNDELVVAHQARLLKDGDRLTLGPYTLSFRQAVRAGRPAEAAGTPVPAGAAGLGADAVRSIPPEEKQR